MQFPLSWLKQWLPLALSPEEIAKLLTQMGIEVDEVVERIPSYSGVVVAEVRASKPHPQAERLSIAQVSDGKQEWTVVCGAPNCRQGMRTAFAPVGATLTDAEGKKWNIRLAKLRGVESHGMLCTPAELKWSDDHEKLIEFDDEMPLGSDLGLGRSDAIFSISLTPNLGHVMSIRGIARELAAVTGLSLTPPQYEVKEGSRSVRDTAKVTVANETLCPRYCCRSIEGVKVGPSPSWLAAALESAGLRSVNNVVDVTNFVLLELGHPLHAFDADKVAEKHIVVRQAYEGEAFKTLDGEEHTLTEEMLVISDPDHAIAIAGVMGGENSEVGSETKNILLESAYFDPKSIRRTSKNLGIATDSSKRFERGTDPNAVLEALDRAAFLIRQVAGGAVAKGVIDTAKSPFPKRIISLRPSRVNQILGTRFSASEIQKMLECYSFSVEEKEGALSVSVPTYRNDIREEIDLVEEIARLYGYHRIPKSKGMYSISTLPHSADFAAEQMLRRQAVSLGLQEWITCDLIGPSLLEIVPDSSIPQEEQLKVINPTSVEQSILRTCLMPGMMEVCKNNWDHQNRDLHAFELGRIHFHRGENVEEPSMLGILLTGKKFPHHWKEKPREIDFFDLKGVVEDLCKGFGVPAFACVNTEIPELHTGRQASLHLPTEEIGWMGEVHPMILRRLDITQRVYFAQLSVPILMKYRKHEKRFVPFSLYPSSERDWTVTVQTGIAKAAILDYIRQVPSRLLESISLIDLYQNEKMGAHQQNATFRFVYRDQDKTVSQEEVEAEHRRLVNLASDWIQKQESQINP